ncbi:hypothetical protein [Endozoicomonas sp. GU-1]|uniref:hypothetical protein n=1 Tax=Endozoicomonas sp. GU-1 TaxID=3009078 RepID=UPI0022B377CA|nr:hypothetical protein [Endozoicomonas sp. GU-1]WBA87865.1 hypothetical protein O3276_07620 [Endozoicomonas sp. GU-1]
MKSPVVHEFNRVHGDLNTDGKFNFSSFQPDKATIKRCLSDLSGWLVWTQQGSDYPLSPSLSRAMCDPLA